MFKNEEEEVVEELKKKQRSILIVQQTRAHSHLPNWLHTVVVSLFLLLASYFFFMIVRRFKPILNAKLSYTVYICRSLHKTVCVAHKHWRAEDRAALNVLLCARFSYNFRHFFSLCLLFFWYCFNGFHKNEIHLFFAIIFFLFCCFILRSMFLLWWLLQKKTRMLRMKVKTTKFVDNTERQSKYFIAILWFSYSIRFFSSFFNAHKYNHFEKINIFGWSAQHSALENVLKIDFVMMWTAQALMICDFRGFR